MAFRFKKHVPQKPIPEIVYESVVVVNNAGSVSSVEVKIVPAKNKPIPSPQDYKLSALIAAGVKLDKASPVINDNITDSDVDFLNSLKPKEDETV